MDNFSQTSRVIDEIDWKFACCDADERDTIEDATRSAENISSMQNGGLTRRTCDVTTGTVLARKLYAFTGYVVRNNL